MGFLKREMLCNRCVHQGRWVCHGWAAESLFFLVFFFDDRKCNFTTVPSPVRPFRLAMAESNCHGSCPGRAVARWEGVPSPNPFIKGFMLQHCHFEHFWPPQRVSPPPCRPAGNQSSLGKTVLLMMLGRGGGGLGEKGGTWPEY